MRRILIMLQVGLIGLLVLTACDSVAGDAPPAALSTGARAQDQPVVASAGAGDPAVGHKLFRGELALGADGGPACITCHAVEPGRTKIGPNLSNIGNRAAGTVPGQPAEEYLRTSIARPDAYLADGFQEGVMFAGYRKVLTPQQIDDLVAYLLTLKSGQDR